MVQRAKRTRRLTGLLLLVNLAALGCGSADSGPVRVDPALAALAPPDAVFLGGVRMEALRATPLYKKWVENKPQPFLDDFARETGLDPRRDVTELLLASDGKQTLTMARGKFAPLRFERNGARRMPYKSYTLIGNEDTAVVLMNSTTAVAGAAPAIRALIDRRGRATAPLLARVKEIPPGSQIWFVSAGTAGLADQLPGSGLLANLPRILTMLETLTLSADLRSGATLTAGGVCRTEQDARSLADAIRGLLGLARLGTPNRQPELLRLYEIIQVTNEQRAVRLQAQIPEELLGALLARFDAGQSRP